MHPARSYAFNRHVSVQKHMIVYDIHLTHIISLCYLWQVKKHLDIVYEKTHNVGSLVAGGNLLFFFCFCKLRQCNVQHAVFYMGANLFLIDIVRKESWFAGTWCMRIRGASSGLPSFRPCCSLPCFLFSFPC